MKYRKVVLLISVLIAVAVMIPAGLAAAYADDSTADASYELSAAFRGYVHDPMENPDAAKDIIKDPNAVYGYSPDPSSIGLGTYAKYDWTDPIFVAEMTQAREDYHDSMKELYQIISDMKAAGKNTEEIARAVSARRNELRFEACKGDQEKIEELKQRNLEAYKNENGPTPEFLYNKYNGSWAMVITKALQLNPGADACVGLYDKYYDTYVLWSKDGKYYVLGGLTYDKKDALVNGIAEIDGVKYCFKNGVKQKGFIKISGSTYYFGTDGAMTTGLSKISGSTYYFDKNGKMKTGAVKADGKLYYFLKSGKGKASKGWFKGFDGKKRYCLGSGRIAAGVKKVGKKYYFFKTGSGKLQGRGFFKYKKNEYYCKGGGKLARGWTAVKKKACYFYPKGKKVCAMAKNTKIGHLKVPKSGRLGEAYALGIKTLNKNGWSLRSAYKYSYKLKYYDRWYRTKSSERYSLRGFKAHHGNCYVMAATFYIQAKLLGYNVHQMRGKVGVWPHSWTEIVQNGKTYVYDPNFRNETGRNGWKIWYGKKGTWRYSHKSRMN